MELYPNILDNTWMEVNLEWKRCVKSANLSERTKINIVSSVISCNMILLHLNIKKPHVTGGSFVSHKNISKGPEKKVINMLLQKLSV